MAIVTRHRLIIKPISFLILSLFLLSESFAEPKPFTARYELLLNQIPVGSQKLALEQTQSSNHYLLSTSLRPNRLAKLFHNNTRKELSEFSWENYILSHHYQLERDDKKDKLYAELMFDWPNERVINDVAGERWQMKIPQGTLDKLNVQIALMHDLANGKKNMRYDIADGGKLKSWLFEVVAEQTIRTAGKSFKTLKVKRIREDKDRTTYLWCAPELNYLPVQIKQYERDSKHTYLSRLTDHHFSD